MEIQTHKLHIPIKAPWVSLAVAVFLSLIVDIWVGHTDTDRETAKVIRIELKELSKEVQSNGKALARIEAILEK